MGANSPICMTVGNKPIKNVAIPMVSREATSVALRPIRSPKCPKRTEPIGRATNATPKVAIDAKREAPASLFGKKRSGKTETAAVA